MASLLLLSLGACSDAGTEPAGEEEGGTAVVSGRLVALGGASPAGAKVQGRWGVAEAGTEVGADGSFEVRLDRVPAMEGFLGVRPAEASNLRASLIRLPAALPVEGLTVLLLPARWTVRAGVHAGREVEVHPADAADASVLPSYWGFTFPYQQEGRVQTVVDSTRWSGGLTTWPGDAFPLPVALDREGSTSVPAPADSAALWEGLDRLEAVLGRDLFRPARLEELPPREPDLGGAVPGAVLVRVDSTLELRGRASPVSTVATWLERAEVASWSGSTVTRLAVASADARAGRIALRSPDAMADATLVMHEAMHVLGAGHGCAWPSLQTYCESLAEPEPTAEDVAHLEVLEAARAEEKRLDTFHGILPAVLGERALTRGEPPLPGVELADPGGP